MSKVVFIVNKLQPNWNIISIFIYNQNEKIWHIYQMKKFQKKEN